MRSTLAAVAALLAFLGLLAAAPAGAVGGTTNVSVVHGIPGLTVDVYVDGAKAIDDFAPGTVAGPLTLPSGSHSVAITASDAADDSAPVLGPASVDLIAGADMSIVAHLDASGGPTVSVFNNDTSELGAGNGRLTVRHLAAAPAVDVLADGSVAFADVANGHSAAADLPAATYEVSLNAAGSSTQAFPAAGTVPVPLAAGSNLIVYAYGTLGTDFALAVQEVTDSIGAPATVHVFHGVPGLIVDVYVDGSLVLEDFAPGVIAGPVLIPAGIRDVEIFAADSAYAAGTGAIRIPALVVTAGLDASIAAHLDADGAPTASVFIDDLTAIADGSGRLTVRHTAAAPVVDVLADGSVAYPALANGAQDSADLPAGTYGASLNAAGTSTQAFPAAGTVPVELPAGVNLVVYAWGALGADFTVAVQTIPGLAAGGAFPDAGGAFYTEDVRTMLQLGITTGTSATTYSPDLPMTRGMVAAFINRTIELPASDVDAFQDDDGSTFEDDINALAAAGITTGTSPTTFSPDEPVTREQMAAFIERAFSIPASSIDAFGDDDGRTLEPSINAVAAAGITTGTSPTTFSPTDIATRGQVASLFARALGLG